MRLSTLTLLVPVVLLGGAHVSEAASAKPQVVDKGGDSLATKAQDIKSVQFRTSGPAGAKTLVVTMTTYAPVIAEASTFNYEVDATTAACGTLSFSMSPGTPYEAVTGLNGWIDSGSCGTNDLVHAQVSGRTITWSMPVDGKKLKKGAELKGFQARIDLAQPALPFPSNVTQTAFGLVDKAEGTGTWRLT